MLLTLMLIGCDPDARSKDEPPSPGDDTGITADDTGGTTDDTGSPSGSWAIHTLTNSTVLGEEDEGGVLSVDCAFSKDGEMSDPGVGATVAIEPMEGVVETSEGWTFSDYGSYTVSCSAEVEGAALSSSETVVVMTEVLDPDVAAVVASINATRNAHLAILAANDGEDSEMVAAWEELVEAHEASQGAIQPTTDGIFRPMPDDYWPTVDELEAEGITRNADDDALAQALTDFGDALRLIDENLAAMDPVELTETDLETLEDLDEQMRQAGDALLALTPTEHGWLENRDAVWDQLVVPANQLNSSTAGFSRTRLENDAAEILPPFGLIGFALGQFSIGGIRGYYINKVIVPVVEQLDLSINNLILMGLIEYFSPGNGGININHIQASSSVGWALPGYETWIYGSGFSTTASMNKFIIVGVDWQEAVGEILDGCGIEEGDTVPEIVDDIEGCIDTVNDAIDNSQSTPSQVGNSDIWGMGVYIGPFPDVCGDGWVPIAIGLMGLNMENGGRTEGFEQLNCIP